MTYQMFNQFYALTRHLRIVLSDVEASGCFKLKKHNKSILSVAGATSDILHLLKPAFHCVQILQILANTNCRKCWRYIA